MDLASPDPDTQACKTTRHLVTQPQLWRHWPESARSNICNVYDMIIEKLWFKEGQQVRVKKLELFNFTVVNSELDF